MTSADDQITRRLDKMDSRQRIAWLREQVANYTIDLSVRVYFRLPFGDIDPEIEAITLSCNLGQRHGLTPDECYFAYRGEWARGLGMAASVGERFEAAAERHIQLYRRRDDIHKVLMREVRKLPAGMPCVTDDDIRIIARRFQHHPRTKSS